MAHDALNLPTIRYEPDDEVTGPADALLPISSFPLPPPDAPTKRSRPRLVVLVILALVSTSGLLAWKSSSGPFAASSSPPFHQYPQEIKEEIQVVQPSQVSAWLATNPPNEGRIPFKPDVYPPLLPLRALAPTLSVKKFSHECSNSWIARGELCPELTGAWSGANAPRIDVVSTWTNGSAAEPLSLWREAVSESLPSTRKRLVKKAKGAAIAKHFRDHDELRHSLRSVMNAFDSSALRALHLVVGDAPPCDPSDSPCLADRTRGHEAQVPHWLNLGKIEFAGAVEPLDGRAENREGGATRFIVHPHSAIFKTPAFADVGVTAVEANVTATLESDESEAFEWRNRVVPSFNSLAIESQIVNMNDVGDTLLNLNDDFFIMRKLAVTDISSPITGPVFRLQRDLGVTGVAPGDEHDDPEGEWRGLGFSNHLLNQRFGTRERPYIVHEGKSVSIPILREAQDAFLEEFTTTAEVRFRGHGPSEVQSSFLLVHYTIEKHREALLWSFFFGRSDKDQDGSFTAQERATLLGELGFDSTSPIVHVPRPLRTTLDFLPSIYDSAGLQRPKETFLEFSSADGCAYFAPLGSDARRSKWPSFSADMPVVDEDSVCQIDLAACFGDDFASSAEPSPVVDAFRRVAFASPTCGDCIIVQLLRKSSLRGLSAFLPPATSSIASKLEREVVAVGLAASTHDTLDFRLPKSSLPIRERCVALIQRYSYIIGDSPAQFISVKSRWDLQSAFRAMEQPGGLPAFVAINDDLPSNTMPITLKIVNTDLQSWYHRYLTTKTRWET